MQKLQILPVADPNSIGGRRGRVGGREGGEGPGVKKRGGGMFGDLFFGNEGSATVFCLEHAFQAGKHDRTS